MLLRVLDRHGVEYVLIGGRAASLHGSLFVTTDVDITPATDPANLDRLAAALTEVEARVRVEGERDGLAFDRSRAALERVELLNLTTGSGRPAEGPADAADAASTPRAA